MYGSVLQSMSPKLKKSMLNTYIVLKPDWKTPGIPGQYIYHCTISKSIKYRDNVEKYDFLFITIYVIHTDTYQLDNEWT